jgi:hypothetical protein
MKSLRSLEVQLKIELDTLSFLMDTSYCKKTAKVAKKMMQGGRM